MLRFKIQKGEALQQLSVETLKIRRFRRSINTAPQTSWSKLRDQSEGSSTSLLRRSAKGKGGRSAPRNLSILGPLGPIDPSIRAAAAEAGRAVREQLRVEQPKGSPRILIQIFRRKDWRCSILLSLPQSTARSRRYPPPTIVRVSSGRLGIRDEGSLDASMDLGRSMRLRRPWADIDDLRLLPAWIRRCRGGLCICDPHRADFGPWQLKRIDRSLDRFRGMPEMDQIGTAAGIGGIEMAHFQAEIIDHRHHPARGVAGAEIAVDIGFGQACIFQRALGDFGMELRGGFIGCMPGGMLVDPGEIGLALDAQLVLR